MFFSYMDPCKYKSYWVYAENVPVGGWALRLDYCLFKFAYLLSLLMELVGGSRNQINAFSKELVKVLIGFP